MWTWDFWTPVIQYGVVIPLIGILTLTASKKAPAALAKARQHPQASRIVRGAITILFEASWVFCGITLAVMVGHGKQPTLNWFLLLFMLLSRLGYIESSHRLAISESALKQARVWAQRRVEGAPADALDALVHMKPRWNPVSPVRCQIANTIVVLWTIFYFALIHRVH